MLVRCECDQCLESGESAHTFEIKASMLDWNIVESSEHESGMGTRCAHEAEWEDVCPKSNTSDSATFTTEEYPAGCVEFNDAQYSGVSPVDDGESMSCDVSLRDSDDNEDEE